MDLIKWQGTVAKALENKEYAAQPHTLAVLEEMLPLMERGELRICHPSHLGPDCGEVPMEGDLRQWKVCSWLKEAIILMFSLKKSVVVRDYFFDKFKFLGPENLPQIRILPPAAMRQSARIGKSVVVMPSFTNVGAWVGSGTMIDTWATVGSCAQIGQNVHLAGGVGIGGVLEPANARPVIIGDDCFIGSRCIVVEGCCVSQGAILAANVCLTGSTPIYDVTQKNIVEHRGYVPPHAVVVMGTRLKKFPGGEVPLNCAYIIAYRNEHHDKKLSLNDVLRDTGIAT